MAGIRNVVVCQRRDESNEEGRLRATALSMERDRFGMRLIGPESFGIMRPHCGLNATLARDCVRPGSLALVSQSGAVCSAILDWAAATEIGFSSVTSIDSRAGVDVGELLDYLLYDEMTKSIMLYLEQVGDARGFMSALRAAARVKPVIVLKAGRHAANGHGPAGETATAGYRDAVLMRPSFGRARYGLKIRCNYLPRRDASHRQASAEASGDHLQWPRTRYGRGG
jgi:acetyltransferase